MGKKSSVELGIEVEEEDEEYDPSKPSVYYEGKKLVIRASALGSCVGNLVRQGMGQTPEEPPEWLQKRFDQGSAGESVILAKLREINWYVYDEWELEDRFGKLHGGQARLEMRVGKTCVIRQHFDGFARDSAKVEYMVEAKLFGPDYMKQFDRLGIDAFPFYKYQVSVGMIATGMPCLFVTGLRDDDGNVIDIFTHVIDTPPMTKAQVKSRAMKIEAAIRDGKVPPCDWAQYPCGFYQDHDLEEGVHAKDKPQTVEVLGLSDETTYETLVSDYHAGHAMEKQGKKLKGDAGKQLWELFGDVRAEVKTDLLSAKPVVQMKSGGVDWQKAAADAGVDVEDKAVQAKYAKPKYESKWFTTTLLDKDEDASTED